MQAESLQVREGVVKTIAEWEAVIEPIAEEVVEATTEKKKKTKKK